MKLVTNDCVVIMVFLGIPSRNSGTFSGCWYSIVVICSPQTILSWLNLLLLLQPQCPEVSHNIRGSVVPNPVSGNPWLTTNRAYELSWQRYTPYWRLASFMAIQIKEMKINEISLHCLLRHKSYLGQVFKISHKCLTRERSQQSCTLLT